MTAAVVAGGIARWLEYTGLLSFVGVVVARRLAANPPALGWARPRMEGALGLALAGGLALGILASLQAGGVDYGIGIRVLFEAVALVLCRTVGRGAVPAGFVAVMAVAFGGHAGTGGQAAPAIFIDALHMLSAGMWAGGLLVLPFLRPPGGWPGAEGREFIRRFGGVAMLAFAITALTGLLRAAAVLNGVDDMWTTAYGGVLAAKAAGVAAMVAMSALAIRRGVPLARAEAAVALAVVAASAALAAFPMWPAGA